MPIQQKDIEPVKESNRGLNRSGGQDAHDETHTETTRYGMGHDAQLNPRGEETEEQEYAADGLPKTTKYSVDKGAENRGGRKERSDCGC